LRETVSQELFSFGPAESAAWDKKTGLVRICGSLPEGHDEYPGSYILTLRAEGDRALRDRAPSYHKNIFFRQIFCDEAGGFYALGATRTGGESRAAAAGFSGDGTRRWFIRGAADGPASYLCGLADEESGSLVLGGKLRDGKPFLQCINRKEGGQEWLQPLRDAVFAGNTEAGAVIRTRGYGYMISLPEPCMAVRVNERGRYITY
jgi:hypothetical protein